MEQSLTTQEASCTDVFVKVCSQLVNKGWNLLAAMILYSHSFHAEEKQKPQIRQG